MSRFEIKMPKLAESITEGLITSWSVKVGDMVKEEDILFEVETAKVSSEIPSPVGGKIIEIRFNAGETVPVGTVIAIIEIEGAASDDITPNTTEETGSPIPSLLKNQSEEKVSLTDSVNKESSNLNKGDEDKWFSPIVLRLAKDAKIPAEELNTIQGTGYLGRLSKKDIVNYISRKNKGLNDIKQEVDRTTHDNVKPREKIVNTARVESDTMIEMDSIRRITAERMIESRRTSAHVTTVVEVDVSKLVDWRKNNKDTFKAHEGITLTYMPAIVEATAQALIKYPEVNASVINDSQIVRKKDINIGIAVALDGWNLIVPVIHNADKLSISGIAQQIDMLAKKARVNKLQLNDIQGGTFTITNFGSFKNILGTPIINQPEVAILGVGYIEKKPAVLETSEGDVIAIRHKMYLSLSYDHRVIDGALGGEFVRYIGDILENWR